MSYTGNNQQPSINQIQPVRVNDDPLNIVLGNPSLDPSFNNRVNFSYYSYKVISNQSINLSGSYSFTNNAIVSNNSTDEAGKSVNQSVNLTEKAPFNFNLYLSADRKIKGPDVNIGLSLSTNGRVSYNYSNNALNKTESNAFSGQATLQKYIAKKVEVYFGMGPTYTVSGSSLQKQLNNNGRGASGYGYLTL